MKIDIHTIPTLLLAKAKAGKVLEATINGTEATERRHARRRRSQKIGAPSEL